MITYPKALDEKGNVHHISAITPENRYDHTFYCIGCGKEMVPVLCGEAKESHFRHLKKEDGHVCNPETYLHNDAKRQLAERFKKEPSFKVSYYVSNDCPRKEDCPLHQRYSFDECFGRFLYTVDLKEQYDTCEIEGTYEGFRADVLLTNSKKLDVMPLFLEVAVSHYCTPEKIASGIRIIEITVKQDGDALRPITESLGSVGLFDGMENTAPLGISFHNFDRMLQLSDMKRLDAFVLLSDGRVVCRKSIAPCSAIGRQYFIDTELELLYFNDGFNIKKPQSNLQSLGLSQAMLKGKSIRHCWFCTGFQTCVIRKHYEYDNPRTKEKEIRHKDVFNKLLSNEEINRYQQAKACPRWLLNTKLCNQVVFDYRNRPVFIWDSEENSKD